jgi:AcrR family transcriptional regulator
MARVRSGDKRNAILTAAIEVVAERGPGATTAAIASSAGVSEGSVFTYFPSKDELLNQVYRELKAEIAGALMSDFPRRTSVRNRLQHVWNRYVDWGAKNPARHRALLQTSLWAGLTQESKAAGKVPFLELEQMHREADEERLLRPLSEEFLGATIAAMSDLTVAFLQKYPDEAAQYCDTGFEMLWAAIARKK